MSLVFSDELRRLQVVARNTHETMRVFYPPERVRQDYCVWLDNWFDERVVIIERALERQQCLRQAVPIAYAGIRNELRALQYLWRLFKRAKLWGGEEKVEADDDEPPGLTWRRLSAFLEGTPPEDRDQVVGEMLIAGLERHLHGFELTGQEGSRPPESVLLSIQGYQRALTMVEWLASTTAPAR